MKIKQFVREIFAQVKRDWYMPVTEHQIYDTTERVIGTYMGKPLYRRVVDCGYGPNKTQKTIELGFHAERYVSIVGTFQGSTFSGPLNNANDSNVQYQFALDVAMSENGDSIVLSSRNMDRSTAHVFVILEYTKTTDTASDSKVPFEPLTEYSTEERMIGYWIDGKPLYRKVVDKETESVIASNTWADSGVPNADVAFIVNAKAYSSGGTCWAIGANCDTGTTIKIMQHRNAEIRYRYLLIEYIKTTD